VFHSEVPFNERGGRLRGALDLVSGRFPRFVFGGAVPNSTLPVFHFHDETREGLEPKLRYLAENGYRTVSSDEDRRVRRRARHTGGARRRIVLRRRLGQPLDGSRARC
jgi:hypothetical protein